MGAEEAEVAGISAGTGLKPEGPDGKITHATFVPHAVMPGTPPEDRSVIEKAGNP